MLVIETLAFTRRVMVLLSDDEYTAMQWFLRFKPDAGDITTHGRSTKSAVAKERPREKRRSARHILSPCRKRHSVDAGSL